MLGINLSNKTERSGMQQLQERVRIFHQPYCPGTITSSRLGRGLVLKCEECGKTVGAIDTAVLVQLLDLIPGSDPDWPAPEPSPTSDSGPGRGPKLVR